MGQQTACAPAFVVPGAAAARVIVVGGGEAELACHLRVLYTQLEAVVVACWKSASVYGVALVCNCNINSVSTQQ